MFDDISFKRIFFVLALIGAGVWYVNKHYTIDDAFKWALARPEHDPRARSIYYVGLYSWAKDDNLRTAEVFSRLLEDHPTCQYAPKALMRLGGAYRDMRRFDEARQAYERYMEEFPNGPDIQVVQHNYEYIKFK